MNCDPCPGNFWAYFLFISKIKTTYPGLHNWPVMTLGVFYLLWMYFIFSIFGELINPCMTRQKKTWTNNFININHYTCTFSSFISLHIIQNDHYKTDFLRHIAFLIHIQVKNQNPNNRRAEMNSFLLVFYFSPYNAKNCNKKSMKFLLRVLKITFFLRFLSPILIFVCHPFSHFCLSLFYFILLFTL